LHSTRVGGYCARGRVSSLAGELETVRAKAERPSGGSKRSGLINSSRCGDEGHNSLAGSEHFDDNKFAQGSNEGNCKTVI
jgi:hypothetical protein